MKKENKITYFELWGLRFPVNFHRWWRLTIQVWAVMLIVLFLSMLLLDYELTNADLPCGTLAGILIAYLIFLLEKPA